MNLLFILATLTLCVVAQEKSDEEAAIEHQYLYYRPESNGKPDLDAMLDEIENSQFDTTSIYKLADIWYYILFRWDEIGDRPNVFKTYNRAVSVYEKTPLEEYYRLFMESKEYLRDPKQRDALSILENEKELFESVKTIFETGTDLEEITDSSTPQPQVKINLEKSDLEKIRNLFSELLESARHNNLDPTEVYNMFWNGSGFLCNFFIFDPNIPDPDSYLNSIKDFSRLAVLIIAAAYIDHQEPTKHIAYLPFICKIRQEESDLDQRAKLSLKEIGEDIEHISYHQNYYISRICEFDDRSEYLLDYLVRFKNMYYFNQLQLTRDVFINLDKYGEELVSKCFEYYRHQLVKFPSEYKKLANQVLSFLITKIKSKDDFSMMVTLALIKEPATKKSSEKKTKISETETIFNPNKEPGLNVIISKYKTLEICQSLWANNGFQEFHKSVRSLFRSLWMYYNDALKKNLTLNGLEFKYYMLAKVCKFVVLSDLEEEKGKKQETKADRKTEKKNISAINSFKKNIKKIIN